MEELDFNSNIGELLGNLEILLIYSKAPAIIEIAKDHKRNEDLIELQNHFKAFEYFIEVIQTNTENLKNLKDWNLIIRLNRNIRQCREDFINLAINYNQFDIPDKETNIKKLNHNSHETLTLLKELYNTLNGMKLNDTVTINSLNSEAKNKFDSIVHYENRAKKSTENIEGLSVAAAGHKQSEFFQKSYNDYFWINIVWFLLITVLIVFLIWGVLTFNDFYSFPLPLHLQNTEQNIQIKYAFYVFLAGKISLVFVSLVAIYFCMKNFNANKHNAILNKHRADSLLTYKAILDVAGADKQDIILTQISECMFKHQDTGFGKPDDSGPSWEQVINLLTKTVGKSKEGG